MAQDEYTQAEAGTLSIPSDIALKCDAACAVYLDQLRTMIEDTTHLVSIQAYGELPSGQQLGAKFARSAQGTPRSLDAVLLQHIGVVESMRAFFRRYFVGVEAQDQDAASNIGSLGPGS